MINSIVKRSLTGILLLLLACNSQSQKEKLVEESTYTAEEIKVVSCDFTAMEVKSMLKSRSKVPANLKHADK